MNSALEVENKKGRRDGFTFASAVILVAVISLSVWASLVLSDIILKSTTTEETKEEMEELADALLEFYRDCDQFPKDSGTDGTSGDLVDLEVQPPASRFYGSASLRNWRRSQWDGPYVQDKWDDNGYTLDSWGNPYIYTYSPGATSCSITSYGQDRSSGGGDDITITVYGDKIQKEKIRKTREELAYVNAKAKELLTRYSNAGRSLPSGFGIDNLFQTYGASTTGLIGWWKMDESAWTGAPNEVVDSSGNANHGRAYGGATTSQFGKLGRCGSFDGNDDYVQVKNGRYFSGDLTVEAWIYVKSVKNWSRLIDFGRGPSNNNVLVALSNGTGGKLVFEVYLGNDSGGKIITSTTVPLNEWIHIVCTLDDGGFGTIYKNGAVWQIGTTAPATNVNRNRCYIAKSNWITDSYAEAYFDEVRVWDRYFTSDDAFQEYLRGSYLTDYAYRYDEWESEYQWDSSKSEFYSSGPDRSAGTSDDIYQY